MAGRGVVGDVEIRPGLVVPARCLSVSFSRSRGPGGQNVNKLETRVELRFDLMGCPALGEDQRRRVAGGLRGRLTKEGVLLFACDTHRERSRNLAEVFERFRGALAAALAVPKKRRPTAPTAASRRRRLAHKRKRAETKKARGRPPAED